MELFRNNNSFFIAHQSFPCLLGLFVFCFHVVIMRTIRIFILIFAVSINAHSQGASPSSRKTTKPQRQKTDTTQQPTPTDQRGTEKTPLFVQTLPPEKTQEETARDTEDREQKSTQNRWLMWFNGILAMVAVLQLIVYGYQAHKLRQTVRASEEQSQAMERHIGEASRSANAMEQIAGVIQEGNEAIMRAYLSVIIGAALFQQKTENIKFEGKPSLVNTGNTPARNVEIRIAAEIVPFAKADTFDYPLPQKIAKGPAVCAPHQTYIINSIVKDFVPDGDVPDIKHGTGGKGALTIWGTVAYDDIFGKRHTTKFGQWLFWYPSGTAYGYYIPGQNDMD